MSEPWTDEEIREAFIYDGGDREIAGDIFDAWLAEHDRQVAERAWDAAIQHQWEHRPIGNRSPHNPYRAAKGEQK